MQRRNVRVLGAAVGVAALWLVSETGAVAQTWTMPRTSFGPSKPTRRTWLPCEPKRTGARAWRARAGEGARPGRASGGGGGRGWRGGASRAGGGDPSRGAAEGEGAGAPVAHAGPRPPGKGADAPARSRHSRRGRAQLPAAEGAGATAPGRPSLGSTPPASPMMKESTANRANSATNSWVVP